MILQYFKKKENKEQIIASNQYKKILSESNIFLNDNDFFNVKNYKTSFEIVSIFLIMFIKINLLKNNRKENLKVNDHLISLFIADLDESLREKGIGDMSIGKYVKSYVKKFYFRISKFPNDSYLYKNDSFIEYLKMTNLIKNDELISLFVSDLDESLREKGIGDMSIGKYVKSYVKKFYFRISKFPKDNNLYKNDSFIKYLKVTDLIKIDDYVKVSRKFNDKFNYFLNYDK